MNGKMEKKLIEEKCFDFLVESTLQSVKSHRRSACDHQLTGRGSPVFLATALPISGTDTILCLCNLRTKLSLVRRLKGQMWQSVKIHQANS